MRRVRGVVVAATLAGCRSPVPLAEVEIRGGTDAQVAEARAELEAFDAWIGPGRLEVARVDFNRLREPISGKFTHGLWRIQIDDDLPPEEVRTIVRHELCHALDDAEALLEEPHPLFDPLSEAMYAYLEEHLDGDVRRRRARRERSETLATLCELGPVATSAFLEPCPGDSPLGTDVIAWVMDEVWTAYEPDPVAPWTGGPTRLAAPPTPDVTSLTTRPLVAPGGVFLRVGSSRFDADVHTGLVLPEEGSLAEERDVDGYLSLPDELFFGTHLMAAVGGGEAVAIGDMPSGFALGLVAERAFWTPAPAAPWQPVAGRCVPDVVDVFAVDGTTWIAWPDGDRVAWEPVVDGGGG